MARDAPRRMRKPHKLKITAEQVQEQLSRFNGNLTAVAAFLKVNRQTVYARIQENEWLEDALHEEREKNLDELEAEIYSQAKNGNITALIFTLKTQGRARGWEENRKVSLDAKIDGRRREKDKVEDAAYLASVLEELEALKGE